MDRCRRCALVAGLLALLLGPLLLLFAKAPIDARLTDEATAALNAKGVSGVAASTDWARITLSGPGSAKAEALAAVEEIGDRSAVDTVTYLASDAGTGTDGTGATPSASQTPATSESPSASVSPSATAAGLAVAVNAVVSGTSDPRKIELTGTVASQAQRKALVDAVTKAYGAGNVTDKLTVQAGAASAKDEAALTQLAAVLTAFGPSVASATVNLKDAALTVTATAKNAAGVTSGNAALAAAGAAGVTVTGKIAAPAGGSTSGGSAGSAAQVREQIGKLLGVRGVTFETGSARLTPNAVRILNRVAGVLVAAPSVKVAISGHTDKIGDAAANQRLSVARAQAVKVFLIAHKVAADRLSAAGYGATRPIATNATAAGRLANRRIDLTVVGS